MTEPRYVGPVRGTTRLALACLAAALATHQGADAGCDFLGELAQLFERCLARPEYEGVHAMADRQVGQRVGPMIGRAVEESAERTRS